MISDEVETLTEALVWREGWSIGPKQGPNNKSLVEVINKLGAAIKELIEESGRSEGVTLDSPLRSVIHQLVSHVMKRTSADDDCGEFDYLRQLTCAAIKRTEDLRFTIEAALQLLCDLKTWTLNNITSRDSERQSFSGS